MTATSSVTIGGFDEDPPEATPNEIFKRMVINNHKQNVRLSSKLGRGPTKYRLNHQDNSQESATKIRFVVCTLGLMSLAMSQMSRMVLNQTISSMVHPSMLMEKGEAVSADGSCPWPEVQEVLDAPVCLPTDINAADEITSPKLDDNSESERAIDPFVVNLGAPLQEGEQADGDDGNNQQQHREEGEEEATNNDEVPSIEVPVDENLAGEVPTGEVPSDAVSAEDIEPAVLELPDSSPVSEQPPAETSEQVNPDPPIAPNGSNSTESTRKRGEEIHLDRFKWTIKQQNSLLGGFYYSYFIFMVLGARMAEIYGAKYVLLLSVGGSGLINLATPWMARNSFALLLISRIVMGTIQAGVFPGMYALITRWLTMSEASIYAPMIKMFLRLGMLLGSLVPGLVSGWPGVYFFTGFLSAVWSVLWFFLATSTPQENTWVSEGELSHIMKKKKRLPQDETPELGLEMERKNGHGGGQQPMETQHKPAARKTPWLKILTAPSVIGLIIVKLSFNYSLDFLSIELPSYLDYVLHASKETRSFITTSMYSLQVVLVVFVGWLAKVVVKKRPLGLSKTWIRKIFQLTANCGMGLLYVLLTFNNCSIFYVGIVLQFISFISMFTAGGETMLPYDLSDEYPATIMAIANSVANLSGITTTVLTGQILGDQAGSYSRWNLLIYLIAVVNIVGGLLFACLIRAEPIDVESKKSKQRATSSKTAAVAAPKDVNVEELAGAGVKSQPSGVFVVLPPSPEKDIKAAEQRAANNDIGADGDTGGAATNDSEKGPVGGQPSG